MSIWFWIKVGIYAYATWFSINKLNDTSKQSIRGEKE